MNKFFKVLNDDGGFKKEILLNNGQYATLIEVENNTAYYNVPCPVCGKLNEFRIYNPNGRNEKDYSEIGGNFTGYNGYSCICCGVVFQPKLG